MLPWGSDGDHALAFLSMGEYRFNAANEASARHGRVRCLLGFDLVCRSDPEYVVTPGGGLAIVGRWI